MHTLIAHCFIFAEDEIENLKSTSTLKDLVHAIKMEYFIDAHTYGLFNLQHSDGEVFYKDTDPMSDNSEDDIKIMITLEDLFGNSKGAEIIYEAKVEGDCDKQARTVIQDHLEELKNAFELETNKTSVIDLTERKTFDVTEWFELKSEIFRKKHNIPEQKMKELLKKVDISSFQKSLELL